MTPINGLFRTLRQNKTCRMKKILEGVVYKFDIKK